MGKFSLSRKIWHASLNHLFCYSEHFKHRLEVAENNSFGSQDAFLPFYVFTAKQLLNTTGCPGDCGEVTLPGGISLLHLNKP